MKAILLLLLLACAVGAAPAAQAPTWPSKPIRWVVPFAPGGAADAIARVIAAKLAARVGQPNIVDNRPGAAGNIAHDAVARATPDGHTILFVVPSVLTNPFYFKASVDPFKDLAPVIHLDNAPMVLMARVTFPAVNAAEVVARIRAEPGAVRCGSAGALVSVGCEMLQAHAAAELLMVQYKGTAPALNALIGGEIDLLFDVVNMAIGQIKSGRVRPIAATTPRRGIGPLGDLPVMVETIPGFELVTWHGVMAPRGTPRAILLRLNEEITAVLADADVRERFATSGLEIAAGPIEAFAALLQRDYERYGNVLRDAGVTPQ